MEKLDQNKVPFVVAAFLGGFHLLWALLVAGNYAQPVLDWVYWVHFLSNPFVLDVFDPGRAALLVVFTTVVGYIGGLLFVLIWNNLCCRRKK